MITQVPGLKCYHIISTPLCRLRDGQELEDAFDKLRRIYNNTKDADANVNANFHFVMTVDRPEKQTRQYPLYNDDAI